MSKVNKDSKKIVENMKEVLKQAAGFRTANGAWPKRLVCDIPTFNALHATEFGTFEDPSLSKQMVDIGTKVLVGNLNRIEVVASGAVAFH